jgi:hypothetical protein
MTHIKWNFTYVACALVEPLFCSQMIALEQRVPQTDPNVRAVATYEFDRSKPRCSPGNTFSDVRTVRSRCSIEIPADFLEQCNGAAAAIAH